MNEQPIKPVDWGPVAARDLTWEKKAQEALDEGLKRTREAAKSWGERIAAFTGILGLVALVKGREDITEIELWAQILVAVMLLLAIVCALIAILYAALAAEGTTSKIWIVGSQIERKYGRELERAERQLTLSRITTLFVPLLLVGAVAFTWFGPAKDATPEPAKVLVSFTDGKATCGDLASAKDSGLAVKPEKGAAVTIANGTVRSLSVVSACPKDK